MIWNSGDCFRPKFPLTQTLRSVGVTEHGTGVVTFVDALRISFYLERGLPGMGYLEAQCTLELFGANFTPDPMRPHSPAYVATKHFAKVFPDAFLHR